MNLQLTKIQKHNAFDYNLLSEFMVKKNGKLVLNVGFGYAGKENEDNGKEKLNVMQKFEREFQMRSILKSYNEAFRVHQKSYGNNLTSINNKVNIMSLPHLNKMKETPNFQFRNYNYKNRRNVRNKQFLGKRKYFLRGQNTFKEILDDVKDDNSVDYNEYFYHTINNIPQGTASDINEKDLNTNTAINKTTSYNHMFSANKNRKLLKSKSQDCVYLFGQHKIILKNKNTKNNYTELATQNSDNNNKTPFIYYEIDFDPIRTKSRLKNRFEFFKYDNFQDFTIIKQDYVSKIRRIFDDKNNFKYHPGYLPSHNRMKTIIRKKGYLK